MLGIFLVVVPVVQAQQSAPHLGYVYPAGGRQGTTFQVKIGGRSLDGVTQVETISSYGANLVHDYGSYTAGQAMLETAERMTPEEREPSVQQYLLLVGGLRALVAAEHRGQDFAAAFAMPAVIFSISS